MHVFLVWSHLTEMLYFCLFLNNNFEWDLTLVIFSHLFLYEISFLELLEGVVWFRMVFLTSQGSLFCCVHILKNMMPCWPSSPPTLLFRPRIGRSLLFFINKVLLEHSPSHSLCMFMATLRPNLQNWEVAPWTP